MPNTVNNKLIPNPKIIKSKTEGIPDLLPTMLKKYEIIIVEEKRIINTDELSFSMTKTNGLYHFRLQRPTKKVEESYQQPESIP